MGKRRVNPNSLKNFTPERKKALKGRLSLAQGVAQSCSEEKRSRLVPSLSFS
jgi:hypothetical protein